MMKLQFREVFIHLCSTALQISSFKAVNGGCHAASAVNCGAPFPPSVLKEWCTGAAGGPEFRVLPAFLRRCMVSGDGAPRVSHTFTQDPHREV